MASAKPGDDPIALPVGDPDRGNKRPLVRDRQTALMLGATAYVVGAVLLWDAFEGRGKGKPFWTKLLPGA